MKTKIQMQKLKLLVIDFLFIGFIAQGSCIVEWIHSVFGLIPINPCRSLELHPGAATGKVSGNVASRIWGRHQPHPTSRGFHFLPINVLVHNQLVFSRLVSLITSIVHHPPPIIHARNRYPRTCNPIKLTTLRHYHH